MALEGLWRVQGGAFDIVQPGNWRYRAMMMLPDHIMPKMFAEALEKIRAKRPSPSVEKLRPDRFREGLCIQTMHIGPYKNEPATVERMEAFAAANGYTLHGLHHEIYLSVPRRTVPERPKTVRRHPVKKK